MSAAMVDVATRKAAVAMDDAIGHLNEAARLAGDAVDQLERVDIELDMDHELGRAGDTPLATALGGEAEAIEVQVRATRTLLRSLERRVRDRIQ